MIIETLNLLYNYKLMMHVIQSIRIYMIGAG